jgi:hypothetical protein
MKTIGPKLLCGHRGDQQAKLSFFIENSFPDILSPVPTHMPNFKRIHQHLQLVE